MVGSGRRAAGDGVTAAERGPRWSLRRAARALALAGALGWFAGCAVVEEPGRGRVPPLTPSPDVSPNFLVPGVRARMIYLARQEWKLFGSPVVAYGESRPALVFPARESPTHEVQGPMLTRVLMYWYAVTTRPVIGHQGELRAWSAAFITWLARSAGVSVDDLPSTTLHWNYIEHSLAAGEGARFVARDAREYAPRAGDLVCAPRRAAFVAEVTDFTRMRRGTYHCDLVVEVRQRELDAIGGNVLDTVAMTRVALDGEGRVVPSRERPWVAVIEQRGE